MSKSEIAVLIPTYQPEDYFFRCLQSLENQTISKDKFCVYIALNGSDLSYDKFIKNLLSDFGFSFNVKYFYLEQPGVSHARNYLINNSTENYIVFVDDDDYLSENYLNNLIEITSKEYMGITNTLSFDLSPEELKPNFIGVTFDSLNNVELSKFQARKYYSSPWAKMLHRDQVGHTRFDEKLKKHEDSLFMAQISKNIKGIRKTSADTFYYVYERQGSASRTKVAAREELKTQAYLYCKYLKLFFSPSYEKLFIATRIAATMKHLKNIF